jgi:shikimate kinase
MTGASQGEDSARSVETLRERLGARSVVLVGMPGSGKTSVGRRLAQRLDLSFVDADKEIEEAAGGMSIADIFTKHGESEFRHLEARVIARLLDSGQAVIAAGGGAFMNPDTRAKIRLQGISVWLKADFAVLLRRIKRKNDRPLFMNGDPETTLKRLLTEREPLLAEADIVVVSQDSPHETTMEAIVTELERMLGGTPPSPGASKEARP